MWTGFHEKLLTEFQTINAYLFLKFKNLRHKEILLQWGSLELPVSSSLLREENTVVGASKVQRAWL